jgi:hypothetical protein
VSCDHSYSVFQYFLSGTCTEVFAVPPRDPQLGIGAYLFFFALTCLLEWPWYRQWRRVLLLNALTHPLVVFVWPALIRGLGGGYGAYLLTAEAFAPMIEGMALWRIWRLTPLKALSLAWGANLFSWLCGGEGVRLLISQGWLRCLGFG